MNIKIFISFLLLTVFTAISKVTAQSTYSTGVLPSINFNKKLQRDWSLNFKTETRLRLSEGEFKGEVNNDIDYILSDFSLIGAKKVGLNSRIAAGYLVRFRDNEMVHRAIQQYSIVQRLSAARLAHRIASDQSFFESNSYEIRLRYRLTSEIPLNGQSVDPKEFYLKINNEYLNSFQGSEYDLEIRIVPLLGFDITDTNKIELGIDYRVNSFLNNTTDHSFWMSINWFIDF